MDFEHDARTVVVWRFKPTYMKLIYTFPCFLDCVWRLDYGYFDSRLEQDISLFSNGSKLALGHVKHQTQGVSELSPWGVKRLSLEVEDSPPSCAQAKNKWNSTFTPPYSILASRAPKLLTKQDNNQKENRLLKQTWCLNVGCEQQWETVALAI